MRITLQVTEGPHRGQVFTFDEHNTFIVGRSKRASLRLPAKDKYFSRVHFMVEINPPSCRLMDLGSRNGTHVNGLRVQTTDLKDGDLIKAGHTVFRVAVAPDDQPAATGPPETQPFSTLLTRDPTPSAPEDGERTSELPTVMPVPPSPAGGAAPRPAPGPAKTVPPPLPGPPFQGENSRTRPVAGATGVDTAGYGRTAPAGPPCPVCGGPGGGAAALTAGAPPLEGALCRACRAHANGLPQPVPGYRVLREIGRGGMGVVYLAARAEGGQLVALKTIIPATSGSPGELQRFLREADILRQLDHPHIVRFREVSETDGRLWFAMDYVRGTDGRRLLKEEGPLPVARAVALVCQLLEALEYAHRRGFVHRDIKPGNLLVADEAGREVVKLADFGLARVYQASQLSGLTVTGAIGGTPLFMAPEQITQYRQAKPPADQYGAAMTLYNLLTDRYGFDKPRDERQWFAMLLEDDPVDIRQRRSELPAKLAGVIHRALAKEPADRFPDVRAMRKALKPFAS